MDHIIMTPVRRQGFSRKGVGWVPTVLNCAGFGEDGGGGGPSDWRSRQFFVCFYQSEDRIPLIV